MSTPVVGKDGNRAKLLWMSVVVFTSVLLSMINNIGIYQIVNFELCLLIIAIFSSINFFIFVKDRISRARVLALSTFIVLFSYSLINSPYLSFSAVLSFYALTAASLAVVLQHASVHGYHVKIIDYAKYGFIAVALLHALTLILFYLFEPVRTTGLLDDFSQASMLLLICFGMAYPKLKDKVYFSAFTLLIFIGYFTSFSRTANFLLVIFLMALLLIEWQRKSTKFALKTIILVVVAFIFVNLYPNLVGETTVDRGGLESFSSLNSRTIYWQTAIDAIAQKPLLGWGLRTYAWTGIQEAQPFQIIYFVHNDYLQIWHDLGIFWLLLMVAAFSFIIVKHSPLKIGRAKPFFHLDSQLSLAKTLSWVLLLAIAAYMLINFLIASFEFQIAIAILIAEVTRNEEQ